MRLGLKSGIVALLLLAACNAEQTSAPRQAASGNDLVCDVTYNMMAGPVVLESQAALRIKLDISPLGNHYTVTQVNILKPWDGRPELDPWRLFIEGRKRPLESVEGDVLTLFKMGPDERGFTINRGSGDLNWFQSAALGEAEYFGGCEPAVN